MRTYWFKNNRDPVTLKRKKRAGYSKNAIWILIKEIELIISKR